LARLFYIIDIKGFAQRNRHILWSRCAGDSSAYLQQKAEKWFIKLSSDVYLRRGTRDLLGISGGSVFIYNEN
jgi:hypothetical protein